MHVDLKFAFRQWLKSPRFTTAAVLTLALGIGANTAIFSVIHAVLLEPLPYREPDRLMVVWADNPTLNLGIHDLPPSQLDFVDWRRQAKAFEQLTGMESKSVDLSRQGESSRVGAMEVTANFFSTVGVQPALGRGFTLEEDQPGQGRVVVISDHLWRREFAGDPNLLGKTITLNDESHVVVGIMPAGFDFPRSAEMPAPYALPVRSELWLPLVRDVNFWQDDINRQLIVIGRLKPDVTVSQAQVELDAISRQAAKERPATHENWTTHLRPLSLQVVGDTRPVLFMLLGAVTFVLLIACANVASLLLSRSGERRKEMAIRAAIGAGRARVVRQLLTESVLLALIGGGFGLLLGAGGLKFLLAWSPPNLPRLHEATLNGKVLAFSLVLSLATGILFGLAPALHASRVSLSETLNTAGRGNSDRRRRGQNGLVIADVAIAFTLIVGATLMLQSFRRLVTLDPGFTKSGIHAFDVTFRGARYAAGPSRIAFFQQIREKLTHSPGIHSVAAVSHLPLGGTVNMSYFLVEGSPAPRPAEDPLGEHRLITTDYFRTMGIRLVRGRDFNEFDTQGKPRVAIVNETLANQFFPNGDAIDKRIRLRESGEPEWCQIVGIVRDVRATALEAKPTPGFYFAHGQFPEYWETMTVIVRGELDAPAAGSAAALLTALRAIDPAIPIGDFRTMETLVSNAVARPRFGSMILTTFAATALMLTTVGLYGVVANTVSQRVRELGVRLALGATPGDILRMIVKQGLSPVLAGLALGLVAAWGLGKAMASLLFEIQPGDPVTFLAAAAILLAVSALACWVPARRASRFDPVVALRME